MFARLYAIVFVALVSAVLLVLVAAPSGATFTAPTTNPANQLATATLAAPTALTAAVQNGTTAHLSWTATSSSWASGHRVYRAAASGGPYSQIQQLTGLATTTYDDTPPSGTYYYVVRGYYILNGANWESANSAEVSANLSPSLDRFSFAVIGTPHSGTAFTVTITAQAADSSTVNYTGTVALTVSSGTISPTTSGAFSAGVRTETVTITGPYRTNETITATGGSPSKTGTSNAFTLDHFRATSVAISNKTGGVAGKPENGDKVVFTFSEAANPASLGTCPGSGTSTGTDIDENDTNPDTLTANGTALSFGTVALGSNGYFSSGAKAAKNGTCAWSAGNTVLTITLQGVNSAGTVAGSSMATWTPAAAITSASGEAIDTAQTPSITAVLF